LIVVNIHLYGLTLFRWIIYLIPNTTTIAIAD
jgi:hypothetical protein